MAVGKDMRKSAWSRASMVGTVPALLADRGSASVDLVVMAAPQARRASRHANEIDPDRYVEWFLPLSAQLLRVLSPRGSFVLNIKEAVIDGERHTYVFELILALRKQGWLWCEEYGWHKSKGDQPSSAHRLPDAWERCLHFTKQRAFKMNQEAVQVPMGTWAQSRLKSLSKADETRMNSAVGNAFGKRVGAWVGRSHAYPTNVLHPSQTDQWSCAGMGLTPEVARWFIKLFSDAGDVVLDPFAMSSVTVDAAQALGRCGIGLAPHRPRPSSGRGVI
jgi:site-specific DNA-methyltransferase (adenine-specific)